MTQKIVSTRGAAAIVILLLVCLAASAIGQDAPKKDAPKQAAPRKDAAANQDAAPKKDAAPKPALSPSAALLDTWNYVANKIITMAEDLPEDKYEFKPTPAQRTFAEQLLHAANSNYFFINPARGEKIPPAEDPHRGDFKSKADIVAFVKKAYADGAAVIKEKGDKGMNDLLVDPFVNQQMRVIDMAYGLIEHSGEHYGQLAVYYRVAGLVPPESRPKK